MGLDSSLSVQLGPLSLKNPVTTASGTFGMGWQFEGFYDVSELGAICCKGCSVEPWAGNAAPRICETASGMMNSVGLANPGIAAFAASYGSYLQELQAAGTKVFVQAVGHSLAEYEAAIRAYEELCPWADAIELNISCPNVDKGGLAMVSNATEAEHFLSALRPLTQKPLIIKMAPTHVTEIGVALEAAGADILSLINTIPAMAINIHSRRSKVSRPTAGLSGPAIHPIAVRLVYELAQATTLPIIGMGGIETYEDAAEMILAGATAIAVGTANLHNPRAALDIKEGLSSWCAEQGKKNISELKGAFQC